jgi:hypothetical protein
VGCKCGKNYLWVTGEVYNRGYGVAFNTVLEVKLYVTNLAFVANSSVPVEIVQSLGDIDAPNFRGVRHAFYAAGTIERWEINVNCSETK